MRASDSSRMSIRPEVRYLLIGMRKTHRDHGCESNGGRRFGPSVRCRAIPLAVAAVRRGADAAAVHGNRINWLFLAVVVTSAAAPLTPTATASKPSETRDVRG